ncbi:MAG: sulfatase-like hydrolase/transferase [Verrucomicrobiota bacterium]|nr:sulfatase-like hydrolase/transferase [Verrucomicrobiota bacterium]
MRYRLAKLGGWVALGVAALGQAYAAERGFAKPNIIILLADDLGYGELGCQGNSEIPTPHIDSISASGVRFTNGYVTAPFCSASRAGLITGRYQTRFGYEFNPIGHHNELSSVGLPRKEETLAERLRQAGYVSSLIGKWHLGGHAEFHPFRHGFDEFFGFTHEGHYFVPPPWSGVITWLRRSVLPGGGMGRFTTADGRIIYSTHMNGTEPAYDANNPIVRGGQPVVEELYLTDAFTREAVDFIGRNNDRPFFLLLAYNAVHSPMQGADVYMKKFDHIQDVHRRIFAAMLSNMDDSVGSVLAKLRSEQLEQNTLIFFLSDNGGPTRELTSTNQPLRDGKGSVYEGGLRVPFMAQWPAQLAKGIIYEQPVISLDIFATAITAAKVPPAVRVGHKLDGVDLLPYLKGKIKAAPHEILFWRQDRRAALRMGDWKLLRNPRRGKNSEWQLYNVASDIAEKNNLAAANKAKREELLSAWRELNSEMANPFWQRQ